MAHPTYQLPQQASHARRHKKRCSLSVYGMACFGSMWFHTYPSVVLTQDAPLHGHGRLIAPMQLPVLGVRRTEGTTTPTRVTSTDASEWLYCMRSLWPSPPTRQSGGNLSRPGASTEQHACPVSHSMQDPPLMAHLSWISIGLLELQRACSTPPSGRQIDPQP